jgi:MFS family permease
MLALLRQHNYSLLWWSALISGIGNAVLLTALPFFVYTTSRSTLATGAAFVSEILPMVLFSSAGGIYADRWNRKRVMVSSDWLRALLVLPLLSVHSTATLWIVYVSGFAGASAAHFAGPFGSAAIPHLVAERELPAANAAFVVGGNVARLIGPAIAGLLVARTALTGVVLFDAATFVVSALMVAQVRGDFQDTANSAAPPEPGAVTALRSARYEWGQGLRLVVRQRWLATTFVVAMIILFGGGILTVTLVPFSRHVLGASAQTYGWIRTSAACGGLIGGLCVGRVSERIDPARILASSLLATGALILIMNAVATIPVTILVMALNGAPTMAAFVTLQTLLQSRVSDRYRGRVFGTFLTTIGLMTLLGSSTASLLTDRIGIQVMQGAGAALYLPAGGVALLVLTQTMPRALPEAQPSLESGAPEGG